MFFKFDIFNKNIDNLMKLSINVYHTYNNNNNKMYG